MSQAKATSAISQRQTTGFKSTLAAPQTGYTEADQELNSVVSAASAPKIAPSIISPDPVATLSIEGGPYKQLRPTRGPSIPAQGFANVRESIFGHPRYPNTAHEQSAEQSAQQSQASERVRAPRSKVPSVPTPSSMKQSSSASTLPRSARGRTMHPRRRHLVVDSSASHVQDILFNDSRELEMLQVAVVSGSVVTTVVGGFAWLAYKKGWMHDNNEKDKHVDAGTDDETIESSDNSDDEYESDDESSFSSNTSRHAHRHHRRFKEHHKPKVAIAKIWAFEPVR
eukprot:Blabericola_migrator_1__6653@NODE_3359_length_1831_cov_120_284014_g2095_i0_p1_GENE_NODE_3359_length_1831_cov_120_284014_g2095_i0NODE_3359_length_1831_cov_120_284014_g2095_i0_p1_ORF_typecomplete_len315_score42_39Herpes_gE/PF02480_16/0_014NicO/PF03824_16/0_17DUF4677/PF15726_5/1_9e03DUF4677/PF15726_5/0_21_NODE_3359_length_1831_cov_120_284014_g2095_i097945